MCKSRFGSGARNTPARKYVRAKPINMAISDTAAMPAKNKSSLRTFGLGRAAAVAITPPELAKFRRKSFHHILTEISSASFQSMDQYIPGKEANKCEYQRQCY